MQHFIFLLPDNLAEYLFADIRLESGFDLLRVRRTLWGRVLLGARSPFSKVIKKLGLYESILNWNICYKLGKYKTFDLNKEYVFVFVAGAALSIPPDFFKKRNVNVKNVLLLMDSFHASSPTAVGLRSVAKDKIWDAVYTFDEFDAKEFGWKNINKCYFSISRLPDKSSVENKNIKSEAFFVGGLKGEREKMILSLFEEGEKRGLKFDFVLSCMNKKQFKNRIYKDKITYIKKWIPYSKVLERTMHTNCIVEILQKNQQAQSIRYFEALYFNKKLLTNNPHIMELPYYNPMFMKYFSEVSEVDFDWLKKMENVDYGYKNDFSAQRLALRLKSDFFNTVGGGYRSRIVSFFLFVPLHKKKGGRVCL